MTPNDNEKEFNQPIKPNPDKPATDKPSDQEGLPKVGGSMDKGKSYFKYALFGLIAVSLIYSGFFSSKKTPNNVIDSKQQEKIRPNFESVKTPQISVATTPMASSPEQRPDINPELVKIQKALEELQSEENKLYEMRLKSPIEVYSSSGGSSSTSMNFSTESSDLASPETKSRLPLSQEQISALSRAGVGDDPNSAFMEKNSGISKTPREEAGRIPYFSETVLQGTMIHGLLDSAINSDLPGPIEGHVTQDVYGPTGILLIPKGSKLNGAYNSGLVMGQKRVCVMWSRVTLPNGVYVMLGSPGTDTLGRSGMAADVLETHFWEKFGGATLVSIVGGLVATAGVDEEAGYNSASEYRMMMSNNFQSSANSALLANMNIKNTIHVYQGDKIAAVVSRDLSFHDVLHEENS